MDVVAGIGGLGGLVWFCCRRRKRLHKTETRGMYVEVERQDDVKAPTKLARTVSPGY